MISRKVLFYLIFFGLLLLISEVMSYAICKKIFIARGLVYDTPEITLDDYNSYVDHKDDDLGWRYAKGHEVELDKSGSRIIPSFPNPDSNVSCVALYGDSYTFSNRTTPDKAWSNQLSILMDCRVANYGVSGFGSDQAYMLFLQNKIDSAKIVILSHFADDISRNVNQNWGVRFTDQRHAIGFKPRFIIDENDNLEKINVPDLTFDEVKESLIKPEKYLKHEYFLPDDHYGSLTFRFPYTYVLLRTIFTHTKFESLFKNEPIHAPYYRADHPSNSLALTTKILSSFYQKAKADNRIPIVNIIPFDQDLKYYRENGVWCYQNLIDGLTSNGVEVLNLGELLIDELDGGDYEYLYAGEGHFNANGDALMSKLIFEYLKEKKYY